MTPSLSISPSRNTSVLNVCSAPSLSSASAVVNNFMVDAGTYGLSALTAKSVSPRLSEITIAPHDPLRVRLPRIAPRSAESAAIPRGVVYRSAGLAGVGLFEDFVLFRAGRRVSVCCGANA